MSSLSKPPLLSVITAVHNGAAYLPSLIESVLTQDYPRIEHIVIDDGSDDDGRTIEVLRGYRHLRWWTRANQGQYATQNEGLAAASGKYVTVIAADDVYASPTALRTAVEFGEAHPEHDVIYGRTLQMGPDGQLLPYQVDITGGYPISWLKQYLFIQHCSLFARRDLVVSHELWFDPSLEFCGDWDWIIRLTKAANSVGYLPKPLAVLRMHPAQASRTAAISGLIRERQLVTARNGGNYRVHCLIRRTLSVRAMTMKGFAIARRDGLGALVALSVESLKRWRAGRSARQNRSDVAM